jgi:CRP-like cAMP-binding protein
MPRCKNTTLRAMSHDPRLIEAVIGNLKLLWGATPAQCADVAARCWALPLPRGSALVRMGERLPGVVAIAYGALKLRIPANGSTERVVRVVAAGESFGESAALLGQPSPFEPVALASCKLVVIPAAAIFALIERDPRLARGAVLLLAEHHLRLMEALHGNGARRGLQRLASYLDSLAEPAAGNGEFRVRLPGTKTLAAAQLGMSKETLSRLLRSLAARGVLRVSRREIAIVDRAALAALAAQAD